MASIASAPSNTRLGTTVTFTDNPLADPQNPANTVPVKADHLLQLRTAVNAVRATANLPAATWTHAISSGALIHAIDVEELRSKVNEALLVFGFTPPTYTDASLSGQIIKRAHIQELRQAVNWGGAENSSPAVILTNPIANAGFISNSNIQLSANASDSDGNVIKVEFFQGSTKIGEDSTSPYSLSWNNVASGNYSLTARATDNNGYQTTSSSVAISVGADFNSSRLDPDNATGQAGENPLSRNFNWSLPIVGLTGRAGLDLGLTLTYNSLVWMKDTSGTQIKYDADLGFPTPGFRLGFPVIEQKYYSSQTGKYTYLAVMPSGSRVELRQVGTTNTYESVDSSYLQLTEDSTAYNGWILRTTDGTQLFYGVNGYQCNKIQDRNGNFISIAYYDDGRINAITDTVGRVIYFKYDVNGRLSSITQEWKPASSVVTYKWAEFTYANQTIQTSFSGITVLGPQNNSQISVLKSVKLADGSSYEFTYNGYGQVYQIKSLAADGHELSHVKYTMDSPTADCPRITERRDYAENWNGGQEAVTTFSAPTAANWTMPDDNASFTGLVCQITTPDSTATKVYYPSSGWGKGLSLLTETLTGSTVQRWVRTKWTQDDENLSYQQNPRVKETMIGDPAGNRKRTIVTYQSFTPTGGSTYSLPVDISEGDATTILRHVKTDYNTSADYTSLRMIGLPDTVQLFEGVGETVLLSKVSYKYDEAYSLTTDESNYLASQASLVQHDSSYGTGTTPKRANLTSVLRWDVEHPSDDTLATVSRFGYDIAGSVIFVKDALNHKMSIRATDAYSAGNIATNTFAYPTTVTNAGGFFSTSTYNYDTGAVTKVTDPLGAEVVSQYDDFGRLTRKTLRDGVANQNVTYTRYEYFPSGTELRVYSLFDTGVETLSLQRFDGAGRVIGAASFHPTNSVLHYSGQQYKYDVMGMLTGQTNPAEIANPINPSSVPVSSWQLTGDDQGAEWKWTTQAYDWKGRPILTTNADGTTQEAIYGGCGCAGGEYIVTRDEIGRRRKITYDTLGRVRKTEVLFEQDKNLPLDDSGNVYSTIINTYNARDQVTNISQYVGTDNTNNTHQETVMTYDGHGRLKTRHVPIQDTDKFTAYTYKADDQVETVTDARGITATYSYNSRHLLTNVSYSVPQGVTVNSAPSVTFTYDDAGNRLSMMERDAQNSNTIVGSTTYEYNVLSRLESETRHFDSSLNGGFTLTYTYTRGGQLKSLIDPFNSTINYGYDNAGRLTDVTGSSFASVTQYATGAQYHAWGALKSLSYGNSQTLSVQYNQRLQPSSYEVPGVLKKSYEYYNDGMQKKVNDLLTTDSPYDRSYRYDHMGRVTEALSGIEARGGTSVNGLDRPYNETFSYDALNHLTGRTTTHWNQPYSSTDTFQNDRRTGWQYDADGRVMASTELLYSYDASGGMVYFGDGGSSSTSQQLDGDGLVVKSQKQTFNEQTSQWQTDKLVYFVNSSVLGGAPVTEVDGQGAKLRTLVYAGGSVLAWQMKGSGNTQDYVLWEHRDPSNVSFRMTDSTGNVQGWGWQGQEYSTGGEYDPAGADVSIMPEMVLNEPDDGNAGSLLGYPGAGVPAFLRTSYTLNGMPVDADFALEQMNSGMAVLAPSWTIVRITSTSGHMWAYTGWTDLAPGLNLSYTGFQAQLAAGGFFFNQRAGFGERISDAMLFASFGGGRRIDGGGASFSAHSSSTLQKTVAEIMREDAQIAALKKLTGNCRTFIQRLINETQPDLLLGWEDGKDNLPNGFIKSIPGIPGAELNAGDVAGMMYSQAAIAGDVKASGKSGVKDGATTWGSTNNYTTITWNKEFYSLSVSDAALQILHESLHLIRGFSDQALARAASVIQDAAHPKFFSYDDKGKNAASQYLNEQIREHCQ